MSCWIYFPKDCASDVIIIDFATLSVIVPLIIYIGDVIIMGLYTGLNRCLCSGYENTSATMVVTMALTCRYSFPAWVRWASASASLVTISGSLYSRSVI